MCPELSIYDFLQLGACSRLLENAPHLSGPEPLSCQALSKVYTAAQATVVAIAERSLTG